VIFTVDIHHHMLPDFFWRATNEGDHPVGGIAPPPWSRASTLSFLDDAGIDVAVTSISTPGVHTGDDTAARALARRCNELAAELTRDRPDRFGGFARTPDVKYVFAHAGGTVPYLAGRFGIIDEMGVIPEAEARATAAQTFRRLYWDTALSWGDPRTAHAARCRRTRPRAIRLRLPLPAPRPSRLQPAAHPR